MALRHGRRILVHAFLLLSPSLALGAALCERSREELFQDFEATENRVSFKNHGGLLNGGVCWWHSRLQRAAIYLADFDPSLPKPSEAEALTLVRDLIRFESVIRIPGYANFSEFSRENQKLIQSELEHWQLSDGFLQQQWMRGLYGRSKMEAHHLKNRMDRVFARFQSNKPGLWILAQMKGIVSHALLVIGMKPTESGYQLRVIDSNRPSETRELQYKTGDQSLFLGSDPFVPYVGFVSDQNKIDGTIKQFCQR